MTTAALPPNTTASDGASAVTVGIDDLIIGRPISFPIYDEKGVLLLAAGSLITSDFKRLLRQHKLHNVQVDSRDVGTVTIGEDVFSGNESFSFDTDLTRRLDQIIEGGMAPVRNTGASVRDSMKVLGRKAYNVEQLERLEEQNNQNRQMMTEMMKSALHGGSFDGNAISNMTGSYLKEMESDIDSVLTSSLAMYDDEGLSAQSLQTSLLSMAIGIEMGLDANNVRTLGLIGMVHDWGMMKVPSRVRNATHPLKPSDFHEICKHPIYSLEMLERATAMPGIVSLVAYQIHERPNGTGYPRGRAGNAIHQFSRIVAVADAYVAMTSSRNWRPPFMAYAAIECLLKDAQKRNLDATVVRHLLCILSLFPIGSLVTLSDGSVSRVLRRSANQYMTPIVQVLQDAQGNPADPYSTSNIIDLRESDLKVEQALPTPGRSEIGLSAALAYREY